MNLLQLKCSGLATAIGSCLLFMQVNTSSGRVSLPQRMDTAGWRVCKTVAHRILKSKEVWLATNHFKLDLTWQPTIWCQILGMQIFIFFSYSNLEFKGVDHLFNSLLNTYFVTTCTFLSLFLYFLMGLKLVMLLYKQLCFNKYEHNLKTE